MEDKLLTFSASILIDTPHRIYQKKMVIFSFQNKSSFLERIGNQPNYKMENIFLLFLK